MKSRNQGVAVASEFWLHIHDDSREEIFAHAPRVQALHVISVNDGRKEETRTKNVRLLDWHTGIRTGEDILVRPRGRGWKLHNATDDRFTVWRRAVKL
jgi:hypothetical protein